MIKKVIMLLLAMLLLTGCQKPVINLDVDFKKQILRAVSEAAEVALPEFSANNSHKEYYDYYLFPGIGRREIDDISNIFVIYDNEAVLNLDVAGILSKSVYAETKLRDIESFQGKSLYAEGTCRNSRGLEMAYRIQMKVVEETAYIILQTNQFIFTTSCPLLEADEMVYEMLKTVRTCSVDTKLVINTYSNLDTAQYELSTIKLFKEILPESGRVIDYMSDWMNDPGYKIIDREKREGEIPTASDIRDNIFDENGNVEGDIGEQINPIQDEDDTIPTVENQQEGNQEEENTDAENEASGG